MIDLLRRIWRWLTGAPALRPAGERPKLDVRRPVRRSIRCEPEVIRPPVGLCGVPGCSISIPHSHVLDLVKRLKEPAGKRPRPRLRIVK